MIIRAIKADITKLKVDAIVNAANSSLLGGSGVDGAIHRAAGPGLFQECIKLGGCKTGQAKITGGHNLPANFIIHTVGPVWRGGSFQEGELLASCYRNSLHLAIQRQVNSIAFPCISTGIFNYPLGDAAEIAIATVHEFDASSIAEVFFCCFSEEDFGVYQKLLEARNEEISNAPKE